MKPPKALSLTQPWATLVVLGEKLWETRSWRTKYRGPLAIHAAKTFPRSAWRWAETDPYYFTTLGKYPIRWMPLGAIIGTVELVEIERVEAVVVGIRHKEAAFGDYSPGRWAWQFANPVVFDEPIPWRGALWPLEYGGMIGCARTGPRHPIGGWCDACPRVVIHRRIQAYEKRRGYLYPGGHIQSTACRIYLDGLGNVYESDGGVAFIIDGCRHVAFVGAL